MTMYVESIRNCPYMRKADIAKEFGISMSTVKSRMDEIEEEVRAGRYDDYAIINDGGIILINTLVFLDYLKYRGLLKQKNARKHVPAFRPERLMRIMGWSDRPVYEEEDENAG